MLTKILLKCKHFKIIIGKIPDYGKLCFKE